jgi:tetratricopeptide (TPR) repeat protein
MVGMGAFYFEDRTWKESKGLAIDYCFGLPFANYGMLRTSLMKKMGYWDESFFRGGGDPDLSLRMWERGMMVVGCQGTRLIHFCVVDEARESTRDILAKDRELFEEKWTERIKPTIMWAESNRDILWRYLDNEGRAEFLFWCGMIQQGRKRFKEAVKHYSEVIDINPSRIDAIYNLASVYRILGQTQKAIQTFQRVLMMSTNDKPRYWAGAYYHLGCLYLERGEHRKAKKYFEDCLSLNPEHNLAKKRIANLVVGLSL